MAGGDTDTDSAGSGDTGGSILYCMRDAVDTSTNLNAHSYPDAYSHSNTAAYDCATAYANSHTASDSDLNAVCVTYTPTSSNPGAYSDSDLNTYSHPP